MSAFGSARFINLVYERSEEKMSKQIYLDNAATTQMSRSNTPFRTGAS